jgi:hypothetical protein
MPRTNYHPGSVGLVDLTGLLKPQMLFVASLVSSCAHFVIAASMAVPKAGNSSVTVETIQRPARRSAVSIVRSWCPYPH